MADNDQRAGRTISKKSRENIEYTLRGFSDMKTQIAVTLPTVLHKKIDGTELKRLARIIQRVLTTGYQAKGYRLFDFSKSLTGVCKRPHFHFAVDVFVEQGRLEHDISEALGWSVVEIRARNLVNCKAVHSDTPNYFAKNGEYEHEACDYIPRRLAAIKRIFDGFGWGIDPASKGNERKMMKRPRPVKNRQFFGGKKVFDFTKRPRRE